MCLFGQGLIAWVLWLSIVCIHAFGIRKVKLKSSLWWHAFIRSLVTKVWSNGQEVLTGSFPTLFTLVHTYSSEQRRKKRLVQCNESVSRYIWKRKTNLGLKSTEVIVPKVGQWLNMLKKWSLALYICIFSHKMLSNFSHTSLKTTSLFGFLIVLFLDY